MRNWINLVSQPAVLTEATVHRLESPYVVGGEMKCWQNPQHTEIKQLLTQFNLRGIITPDALFVWNAHDSIHAHVENALENAGVTFGNQLSSIVLSDSEDFSDFDYWEGDPHHEKGVFMLAQGQDEDPCWDWPILWKLVFGNRSVT